LPEALENISVVAPVPINNVPAAVKEVERAASPGH
jgi:hypothetical protein